MMDFKKLLTRTISGLIYCGIIIACILLGLWGVFALASLLSVLACIEFAKIDHELTLNTVPTLILDITGCLCLAIAPIYPVSMLMWLTTMVVRFIEQIYVVSEHPVKDLAHSIMMQIYIGIPMLVMTLIGTWWSPMVLLAMFCFLWINDTGAFLVGSLFGRHRLFERISPKKSWEGFFGGLILNVISAMFFYLHLDRFFHLDWIGATVYTWMGFAVIVTLFGTWGDLIESMIKRNLHIKDSGTLIPGHGGILDRIDSMLMALPAVLIYFCLIIFI